MVSPKWLSKLFRRRDSISPKQCTILTGTLDDSIYSIALPSSLNLHLILGSKKSKSTEHLLRFESTQEAMVEHDAKLCARNSPLQISKKGYAACIANIATTRSSSKHPQSIRSNSFSCRDGLDSSGFDAVVSNARNIRHASLPDLSHTTVGGLTYEQPIRGYQLTPLSSHKKSTWTYGNM
jgi:hypothetical protein